MPFDESALAVPFRMQPGLRRAAAGATPLTPASPSGRHFREKLAVLSAFPNQAVVAEPTFDPAPALSAIAAEAARDPAPAYSFDVATGDSAAPQLGWALRAHQVEGNGDAAIGWMLRQLPPARRTGALLCLAFEEDFAVIDAGARIPWLAVCLPSRWAPEEKVGRHFTEVHAPVADNAMLIAATDALTRLVTGPDRWQRTVWTISADPRLHQHPARSQASWPDDASAAQLAAQASFRHESQAFLPVPAHGQAVFTIHVESEPLPSAVASAQFARRLHDALASMSPAVVAYRGLDAARDRLLEWLATRVSDLSREPT